MAWPQDWTLLGLVLIVGAIFDAWAMQNSLHNSQIVCFTSWRASEHTGRFGGYGAMFNQ